MKKLSARILFLGASIAMVPPATARLDDAAGGVCFPGPGSRCFCW